MDSVLGMDRGCFVSLSPLQMVCKGQIDPPELVAKLPLSKQTLEAVPARWGKAPVQFRLGFSYEQLDHRSLSAPGTDLAVSGDWTRRVHSGSGSRNSRARWRDQAGSSATLRTSFPRTWPVSII